MYKIQKQSIIDKYFYSSVQESVGFVNCLYLFFGEKQYI